jgi:methylglyoxal synthase
MRGKNQEGLRLAVIAHDNKKIDLIAFVQKHSDALRPFVCWRPRPPAR